MILVQSALVPLVCALLPSWLVPADLGDGIHSHPMRRKPVFAAQAT